MSAVDQIHAYLMSGYEDWPEPHKTRISPKVMAEAEELYEAVAHELAEKIQGDMEQVREADWGKGSRSKRPYLQGMERAKKVIDPKKEGQ